MTECILKQLQYVSDSILNGGRVSFSHPSL